MMFSNDAYVPPLVLDELNRNCLLETTRFDRFARFQLDAIINLANTPTYKSIL